MPQLNREVVEDALRPAQRSIAGDQLNIVGV
jgi:hypothetical protein